MSKLKILKESHAAVSAKIDELRIATDGREMTSEDQERWNTLLADYERADRAVEAEERYVDIERRQAEAAARTGLGAVQQLKNAWGDFL